MKILVVDDELVSRKKMEKIMVAFGECVAVDCGKAALKEVEKAIKKKVFFDLITLDVSMPLIDGTEVLYEIRRIEEQREIPKEKRSKVIMVTTQSDKDTVITCMQAGCDSYIVKPFDKTIIAKNFEELGISAAMTVPGGESIREMVMETIRKFNQGKVGLPVLPQILRKIKSTMKKPISNTEELIKIIEKDAVISVNIIAAANSALYKGKDGEPLPEDNVQYLKTAIARIGDKEIPHIVSDIAKRNIYESKYKLFNTLLKKLWLHSLCCAYCCRAISFKLGNWDTGKIFLMGLTHKIGCAILLKSISDMTSDKSIYDKTELMECLYEAHSSLGAAVLTNSGFGREFSEVIRMHKWNSFDKETRREVLIVNLADKITSKIKYGFFESDANLTGLESAIALGFDAKTLEKIAEDVRDAMKGIRKVFM